MAEYDVFTDTPNDIPADTESLDITLSDDYQIKVTLSLRGTTALHAGDFITVAGVSYKVTNVSYNKSGNNRQATITARNAAYDLHFTTSDIHINWVSIPTYIERKMILDNLKQPFLTDLRAKITNNPFGAVDGNNAHGWLMSEIIADVAAAGGWASSVYNLPDFHVKQLTLDRKTPILDFIRSALSAFMPRVYVLNNTLYVDPPVITGGTALTISELEEATTSETVVEPYKTFRISGGSGAFRTDKWEGSTLLYAGGTSDLSYYMNSVVGHVTTTIQNSTRTYFSEIEDAYTKTLTASVYSTDIFSNDHTLIFKEDWRFKKKEPQHITNETELNAAIDGMNNYEVIETGYAPSWPSETDYILESCNRLLNVYEGVSSFWEHPILVEQHRSEWQYLWWMKEPVGNISPPAASIPVSDSSPFGLTSLPGSFPATLDAQGAGFGYIPDVTSVFSTEAFYERTIYKYEYSENDTGADDVIGGLLLERNQLAMGVVRSVYPNTHVNADGTRHYGAPDYEKRVVLAKDANPNNTAGDVAYQQTNPVMVAETTIESYRQVSLRSVLKTRMHTTMRRQVINWMEVNGPNFNHLAEIQYQTDSSSEFIPYDQAPQAFVSPRAMTVYYQQQNGAGHGKRFAEVSAPLVIDWTDMNVVKAHILQYHPSINRIHTLVASSPETFNPTLALLGGAMTSVTGLPSDMSFGIGARLVGATVARRGDGTMFSQIAAQWEETP